MGTKTFTFDARGYKAGLAGAVDDALNAWITDTSPTSVDNMDMTMSDELLIIVVSFTA